jgi:hypothetical protein
VALAALVGSQLGQTLRSGGLTTPVVTTSLLSVATLVTVIQTPGLSHFFGCRPLGPLGWSTALLASVGATRLASAAERALQRDLIQPLQLVQAWGEAHTEKPSWPAASEDSRTRKNVEGPVVEAVFVDAADS